MGRTQKSIMSAGESVVQKLRKRNKKKRKKEQEEVNKFEVERVKAHVESPFAFDQMREGFINMVQELKSDKEFVVICIGTDRSTGDCLGPIVGTKLKKYAPVNTYIYGCLDEPVHAVNIEESINDIKKKHKNAVVIAIDACLGKSESVGYLSMKHEELQPGSGVNKELPSVGDYSMMGVVNIGGFMEYMVLQNTRLSLVIKMAEIISDVIHTSLLENGKW